MKNLFGNTHYDLFTIESNKHAGGLAKAELTAMDIVKEALGELPDNVSFHNDNGNLVARTTERTTALRMRTRKHIVSTKLHGLFKKRQVRGYLIHSIHSSVAPTYYA